MSKTTKSQLNATLDAIDRWEKNQTSGISCIKRSERKSKIKRVLNYDLEMNFLLSFYNLKFKNISMEEFEKFTKTSLVDTNLVSDCVFEFFMEEIKIKEEIKAKKLLLENIKKSSDKTLKEIRELENLLKDERETDLEDLGNGDDGECNIFSEDIFLY